MRRAAAIGLVSLLGASAGCSLNPLSLNPLSYVFNASGDDAYEEMARATPETSTISGYVGCSTQSTKARSGEGGGWYEFYVVDGQKAYFCRCDKGPAPDRLHPGATVEFPARPIAKKRGQIVYDGCDVTPADPSSVPSSR